MPSLYRFTTFQAVVDMNQRKQLTLVSPSLWLDPYEGYVYAAVKTAEGRKRVAAELAKHMQPVPAEGALQLLTILDSLYFVQCWSRKPESDALWRIYSHDNMSVRIEVDQASFSLLEYVFVDNVIYLPNLNLESEVRELLSADGLSLHGRRALLTKRDAFQHEEEVRIIVQGDTENMTRAATQPGYVEQWQQALTQAVQAGQMPPTEASSILSRVRDEHGPPRKLLRKSFDHVPQFVKSLMLHPLAPSWLDDTLAEYCRIHGIHYLGKSKLYDFSIQ